MLHSRGTNYSKRICDFAYSHALTKGFRAHVLKWETTGIFGRIIKICQQCLFRINIRIRLSQIWFVGSGFMQRSQFPATTVEHPACTPRARGAPLPSLPLELPTRTNIYHLEKVTSKSTKVSTHTEQDRVILLT